MKGLKPNSVSANIVADTAKTTVVKEDAISSNLIKIRERYFDKDSLYLFDVVDIVVRTSKNDLNNENHFQFLATNIHLQYRMILSECNKKVNDGVTLFERLNNHAIPGVLDNIDSVISDCIRTRSVKPEYRNMVLGNIIAILKFMELPKDSSDAAKLIDFINYFFDSYEKIDN